MSSDNKRLSIREVEDLTRRALSACGASGQQFELGVQSVVDGGALAPAGGHKGMLLGLLVDVPQELIDRLEGFAAGRP